MISLPKISTETKKLDFTKSKDRIKAFKEAQQKAEKQGKHIFECPVCHNNAFWNRARMNQRLLAKCEACGLSIQ